MNTPSNSTEARVAHVFWRELDELDRCVSISHILVRFRESAQSMNQGRSREEALTAIQSARQSHEAGEPFASVARRVSDCPSGSSGGFLGEFLPEELMDEVRAVVEPMAPNSVSDIVESPMGFHLFYRMW